MQYNNLKDHRHEHAVVTKRIWTSIWIMLFLWCILIGRLFYLQILSHDALATQSEDNRIHLQTIPPTRGLIYDRNNALLAENKPSYTLMIIRERVKVSLTQTLEDISKIITLKDNEIEKFYERLRQSRRFEAVPLKYKLNEEEIAKISVNMSHLPGIDINAQLVRQYPMKDLLSHAVGYVGRINSNEANILNRKLYSGTHIIGKTGIEGYYEDILLGKPGYQEVETNASGRILRIIKRVNATTGRNLTLFLDTKLQKIAVDALGKNRGAVVAIEPKTGGILVLASTPSFDPNLFVTGIDRKTYNALRENIQRPLFNRATLGEYPPASTIKPFMALAALQSNTIKPSFTIKDPGFFKLDESEHKYRNWLRRGHGYVNLHRALVVSNDTFFYTISVKMGIKIIHNYLTKFGFGIQTGLDTAAERPGLIPSPAWKKRVRGRSWYTGETVITGIGQGYMLTTPLQLALATTLIANRGHHVLPRFVKSISPEKTKKINNQPQPAVETSETKPDTEAETEVENPDNSESDKTQWKWEEIISAMEDSIKSPEGTGHRRMYNRSKYSVAGKTGTAQVVGIAQDAFYNAQQLAEYQRDHGLFIGFAPVNSPQIAIAVIVENNSKQAVPIAKKIFDYWLVERKKTKQSPASKKR